MSKAERIEDLESEVEDLRSELSGLESAIEELREEHEQLKFQIEDGAKGILFNVIFVALFGGALVYAPKIFALF